MLNLVPLFVSQYIAQTAGLTWSAGNLGPNHSPEVWCGSILIEDPVALNHEHCQTESSIHPISLCDQSSSDIVSWGCYGYGA